MFNPTYLVHVTFEGDGIDPMVVAFLEHMMRMSNHDGTVDLARVVRDFNRHDQTDATPVLVGLFEDAYLTEDGVVSIIIASEDECAEEWRELTAVLPGLELIVAAMPQDTSSSLASTAYHYWSGKRSLLIHEYSSPAA